ncbi:MAG: DUF6701 domain-containing protein, partial [Shewanella sp.]
MASRWRKYPCGVLLFLGLIFVLFSAKGVAAPLCSDIFTNPATGGHDPGLVPPYGILNPPRFDKLICTNKGCDRVGSNQFTPGDYDYNVGDFSINAVITTAGKTTRLYFNSLSLTNVDLNLTGKAEDLIIYVKNTLNIAGQNKINAIIYVAGDVKWAGGAVVTGAFAAGGALTTTGNATVTVDLSAVDKADFGGMCGNSTPVAQIDHFEFDHTGQGLTCNPETVTIRACANANINPNAICTPLFIAPLSATLLPDSAADGVWVGGNPVSVSGGTAQLQLRRNTPGVVTLGVKGSNPTTKSETLCRIGNGALSKDNCSLTFADTGFVFDVPDKLANKPVDVLVKAVKKSDVTQQCIPSFQNQTKTLNFWSSYLTPSAPISPQGVTINNTPIGISSALPTAVSLPFDTNGQASISVNYPDAGTLQLDAKYTGVAGTPDEGLVMTGSDQFVSVPAGLCVKPVDASASCPSADMSCNVYRKAGQP